jgi:hypothetical protein
MGGEWGDEGVVGKKVRTPAGTPSAYIGSKLNLKRLRHSKVVNPPRPPSASTPPRRGNAKKLRSKTSEPLKNYLRTIKLFQPQHLRQLILF